MAIVLAEIQLNERDGQLIVDKYLYNNSFPEYVPTERRAKR